MARPDITETSLEVSRVIRAPREAVYRALTDPGSRYAKRFVPDQAPGEPMELTFESTEPAREGDSCRVTMTADEGPAEGPAASDEFQEAHEEQRGYHGTLVVDAGDGRRLTVNLWVTAEDAEAALPRMRPVDERLLEPMMAEPSELLGRGPVVLTDLPDLLETR